MSKPRNPFVEHARRRKGGAMSSRNEKRGGANARALDEEELDVDEEKADALEAKKAAIYRHYGIWPEDNAPALRKGWKPPPMMERAEMDEIADATIEKAKMSDVQLSLYQFIKRVLRDRFYVHWDRRYVEWLQDAVRNDNPRVKINLDPNDDVILTAYEFEELRNRAGKCAGWWPARDIGWFMEVE